MARAAEPTWAGMAAGAGGGRAVQPKSSFVAPVEGLGGLIECHNLLALCPAQCVLLQPCLSCHRGPPGCDVPTVTLGNYLV